MKYHRMKKKMIEDSVKVNNIWILKKRKRRLQEIRKIAEEKEEKEIYEFYKKRKFMTITKNGLMKI